MKNTRVIDLEPKRRVLEKVKRYVDSIEVFCAEREQALPLLLRALKLADHNLKHEIMLTLGSFAKNESVWPLYEIMVDPSENEDVRRDAAIQLSVIGSLIRDPQPLVDRLLADITSADAQIRMYATFAIGWRDNFQAAIPLIERLYDSDDRVRQTAVDAMCNLKHDGVLKLLLERLNHGDMEYKRTILLNLWRFDSKREQVIEAYVNCLEDKEADLRFDALACLGLLVEVRDRIQVYGKCLGDVDKRIRGLAIKKLDENADKAVLQSLRSGIELLLDDPDVEIKRAALKLLRKI